ncbi:hypothetical protein TGPRC2_314310 [Toxoplasma gondii TgCatPRC2]|uniref:Uncharacterized protein n=1 Tax=Toxoplasma gondii TgCatPRC2 TaxID=1130821 RepID=A0A151H7Q7_TOXGO|nr:hypothetical protein TGPRC2_314310 [Toxoplasma gondii TgCatPRC2]
MERLNPRRRLACAASEREKARKRDGGWEATRRTPNLFAVSFNNVTVCFSTPWQPSAIKMPQNWNTTPARNRELSANARTNKEAGNLIGVTSPTESKTQRVWSKKWIRKIQFMTATFHSKKESHGRRGETRGKNLRWLSQSRRFRLVGAPGQQRGRGGSRNQEHKLTCTWRDSGDTAPTAKSEGDAASDVRERQEARGCGETMSDACKISVVSTLCLGMTNASTFP